MIDFERVPKVALEFMNRDHEEATRLTNQLEALVRAEPVDSQAVAQALNALLDHCQAHFGREEAQMQAVGFPPYPVHKGEHERVLAEMHGELVAWLEADDLARLKHYLLATLPRWFVDHIATMDTVTASFIQRMAGPK